MAKLTHSLPKKKHRMFPMLIRKWFHIPLDCGTTRPTESEVFEHIPTPLGSNSAPWLRSDKAAGGVPEARQKHKVLRPCLGLFKNDDNIDHTKSNFVICPASSLARYFPSSDTFSHCSWNIQLEQLEGRKQPSRPSSYGSFCRKSQILMSVQPFGLEASRGHARSKWTVFFPKHVSN